MYDILVIAKKEFMETLREKRTLVTMIIVPILIFPVIMTVFVKVTAVFSRNSDEKLLKVALINNLNAERLEGLLSIENIQLFYNIEKELATELINEDSLDAAIIVESHFDKKVDSMNQGRIELIFKSTSDKVRNRLIEIINLYKLELREERIKMLGITSEQIEPMILTESDISSSQEIIGKYAGGFLPYIFILFCFIGALIPAIDLFAGEKERGTFETLMTLPVSRISILIGKMVVMASTGLFSALFAFFGLLISAKLLNVIPDQFSSTILNMVQPGFILMLFAMLIPMAVFFAGVLTPISLHAKTFKEAQSIMTPLQLFVILAAMLGLMPGVKLNAITAIIPIVNVTLCTKEIISGTIDPILYMLVVGSLISFAVLAVIISFRWVDREENVLRQ